MEKRVSECVPKAPILYITFKNIKVGDKGLNI